MRLRLKLRDQICRFCSKPDGALRNCGVSRNLTRRRGVVFLVFLRGRDKVRGCAAKSAGNLRRCGRRNFARRWRVDCARKLGLAPNSGRTQTTRSA